MNKRDLENQALLLIKQGKSQEDIEKELAHEFIFFKNPMTQEYSHATLWK